MVIFHSYVNVYQRVHPMTKWTFLDRNSPHKIGIRFFVGIGRSFGITTWDTPIQHPRIDWSKIFVHSFDKMIFAKNIQLIWRERNSLFSLIIFVIFNGSFSCHSLTSSIRHHDICVIFPRIFLSSPLWDSRNDGEVMGACAWGKLTATKARRKQMFFFFFWKTKSGFRLWNIWNIWNMPHYNKISMISSSYQWYLT